MLTETLAGGIMAHGLAWLIEPNIGMAYWNEGCSLPLAAHTQQFQQNGTHPAAEAAAGYLTGRSAPHGVSFGPDFLGEPHAAAASKPYAVNSDGVAQFAITGPMTKQVALSASGTSTVYTRRIVSLAERDPDVKSGILKLDSPGGTVAGTDDLAGVLRSFAAKKPLYAFCEDMTASAAYWAASACTKVYATQTTHIGSIGTILVIPDLSRMAEKAGVEVHVFTNDGAELKGAGAPGTPVTDAHKLYFREMVNQIQAHFSQAVQDGRGLTPAQLADLGGRVFIADQAKARGLIDGIRSWENVGDIAASAGSQRTAFALGGLPGLHDPIPQAGPQLPQNHRFYWGRGGRAAAETRSAAAEAQAAALVAEKHDLKTKIVRTAHALYGPIDAARHYQGLEEMNRSRLETQAQILEFRGSQNVSALGQIAPGDDLALAQSARDAVAAYVARCQPLFGVK